MNKNTRVSKSFLVLLGFNILFGPLFAKADQSGDWFYSPAGTTAIIIGYCGPDRDMNIPETISNLTVTSIGNSAFLGYGFLTSVTIPNSVTNIGNFAFDGCSSLTSVTIAGSATTIAGHAFAGCSSLTSVTVGGSVIGSFAFANCSSLTNVTIAGSVTTIESDAFFGCTNVTSIIIPASVTDIGGSAFDCVNLVHLSVDMATLIGNWSDSPKLTTVTLGNHVKALSDGAFSSCPALTSIDIPSGVTSIGSLAFSCSGLATVTIPSTLTNIGYVAFSSCEKLTSVTIDGGTIPDGTFEGCAALTNVTVHNGVIGDGSLYYMQYRGVFSGCTSLRRVTIDNGVIGPGAFANCTNLSSLTMGNGVTAVGFNAAYGCALTNVTIPSSVTSVGSAAFGDCSRLSAILVDASNLFYSSVGGVLHDSSQTTLVECPGGITGGYTVSETVTRIWGQAFCGCRHLARITMPKSVTSIGDTAFWHCTSLTNITCLGDAPALADDNAFWDTPIDTLIVYYMLGTAGWGPWFGPVRTAAMNATEVPDIEITQGVGIRSNSFGFIISGPTNIQFAVEACTNLVGGLWLQLTNATLFDGYFYFCDPTWTNYQSRFYRLAAP